MEESNSEKRMQEAEAFLYEIPKFTRKNPPAHTRALMHALGDPQEKLRVIHVAGSNGKGSVCSFLFHILKENGFSAGLFISPHLTDIRERFQTDEGMCSRQDFLKAYERVKQEAERMQEAGDGYPTFFEFLYAMGMLLFVWAGVDYAVVETGLGGRLDCTNVVKKPLITIITSISLEHTEYLGNTIPEIAAEKAGILKEGVPAVIDGSNSQAADVIEARAQRLHVPLAVISGRDLEDVKMTEKGVAFTLHTAYDRGTKWQIPFYGLYQAMNAALAITAYRILADEGQVPKRRSKEKIQGLPAEKLPPSGKPETGISDFMAAAGHENRDMYDNGKWQEEVTAQILRGLAATKWPGRMQEVRKDVFLDGAHNPDGIRVFLESVQKICSVDPAGRPLLLFSMVRDKDYKKSVRLLCEGVNWAHIVVSHIPSERGLLPETLLEEFSVYRKDTEAVDDCREAFRKLLSMQKKGQKLFCTGSLYFIGELLKECRETTD